MKKATVLKSFRTVQGAEDYLKIFKTRLPEGALVVKSLGGYGEVCSDLGSYSMSAPSIVIEESLSDVTASVSEKDVKDFVAALMAKDLVEVGSGGVHLTEKFYDLLQEFNKKAFEKFMLKAIDAAGAMGHTLQKQDLEGKITPDKEDAADTLHSVVKSMTEKKGEVNGHESPKGISEGEAHVVTDGVKVETKDGCVEVDIPKDVPQSSEFTQDKVDNLEINTTAITEKYPTSANDIKVFKSLPEARGFEASSKGKFHVRELTFEEKRTHGTRFRYIAEATPSRANVRPFGNRSKA